MNYKIYKNGVLINTIRANFDFVEKYCTVNDYTYEEDVRVEPEPNDTTPVTRIEMDNALKEQELQTNTALAELSILLATVMGAGGELNV